MCSHQSPPLGEVPELAAPLSPPPRGGGVGFMGLISLMGLIGLISLMGEPFSPSLWDGLGVGL